MNAIALIHSLDDFKTHIRHEFCHGSAIDPSLFQAAVEIRADLEYSHGHDPQTPIHDALNWHFTRFGAQARDPFYAALLLNETGDCWQAKLSTPRIDARGKRIKYDTPKGNGSRAFLPAVPPVIRRRIAQRYLVEVPLVGSFWDWLEQHPELFIIWTEGGKKSLSLLSQGYVAIALNGVNGGYRKPLDGSIVLSEDVNRFASPQRHHVLAFDQDETPKTRRRVATALHRFSGLLSQSGGTVAIARWPSAQGKGVDDLIVQAGPEVLHTTISSAVSCLEWKLIARLEHRLTTPATYRADTVDLSTLDRTEIPDSGIIAIAAPKGTGKTKLQVQLLDVEVGAIALSHRIALSRNFCTRMGLDYRGDIAGAKQTGVVQDGVYRMGLGSCVDALLSIDPAHFAGRDVFIDEVVQVIRHLLTSSTCAKDGKRPALLVRFRALVQGARRVIVADADLDSATLHYLRELRGDRDPVFLIQNDYQATGYPITFINAPDRSVITQRLLADAAALTPGRVVFVATDSKASSKHLATLLQQQQPQLRILLINSETSGCPDEREFIEHPDRVLARGDYDLIMASPSLATGVSIEAHDLIERVYGIFTGVSSTDADMAQALGRVRQPVERVVWCSRVGSNYSKVSRSTSPLTLKSHLMAKTSATISLVRSSLKEDTTAAIATYDWQSDPHLNLFARIEAERNLSMCCLRDALRVRLCHEGHQLSVIEAEADPTVKNLLKSTRDALRLLDAEAVVSAADLTLADITALETRDTLSLDDQRAIAKHYLKEFYSLDALTVDEVLWDKNGQRRAEIAALEALLYPDVASDRTVKSIEQQATWNCGNTPWDFSSRSLQREIRERLGLRDFLNPDKAWSKLDLKTYGDRIRHYAEQVKVALNFTITPTMSDAQIVHQLLSQMGIKITFTWSRSIPGLEGEKAKLYRLDGEQWQAVCEVLHRRKQRRDAGMEKDSRVGSPPWIMSLQPGGDPDQTTHQNIESAGFQLSSAPYFSPSLGERAGKLPTSIRNSALAASCQPKIQNLEFKDP